MSQLESSSLYGEWPPKVHRQSFIATFKASRERPLAPPLNAASHAR